MIPLLIVIFLGTVHAAPIVRPEVRSWEETERLEADGGPEARRLLLEWYTRHYRDSRSYEPRLRHILWVIQHAPDLSLYDSRSLLIEERDPAFARVREAWLAHLRGQPHPVGRLRAAEALSRSDRALALKWLLEIEAEARRHATLPPPPESHWWNWPLLGAEAKRVRARLQADTISGVIARTPWLAVSAMDPDMAQSALAHAARRSVTESNDAAFIVETAWWISLTAEEFSREGRLYAHLVALALAWMHQAERLDRTSHAVATYASQFPRVWHARLPSLVPAPPERIRDTQAPIDPARPVCGVPATVRVIVTPEGTVRFALPLSGPPEAALHVLTWRYAPRGVEVETQAAIPGC